LIRTASILAALAWAGAALSVNRSAAQDFSLAFPVDYRLGTDCFIQNHVDRDPTGGHRDFGCGHLSYDGHSGTDIALYSEADLDRDVAVFAVAPGTVRAIRDGMPDVNANDPAAPDLSGRSCGNAVVIRHADSWETRYCHLKQGSVIVRSGDSVDAGTQLGAIGLSGRTEFPHLHLTLVRDGAAVDPFQPKGTGTCGAVDLALWQEPLEYVPAGLLTAGAAPAIPQFDAVKAGLAGHRSLARDADALVFWVHLFGSRAGDVLRFEVEGPDGAFLNQTVMLERDQARAFRAVGRRRGASEWALGRYSAAISLIRNGAPIDKIQANVELR